MRPGRPGEQEPAAGRDRAREAPARRERRVTARLAARLAADHVAEMTGKEPEEVTSLEHSDNGRWHVAVEVVELHKIPDTTDILALYEAELDEHGELVAYRRTQRYTRSQVLEE